MYHALIRTHHITSRKKVATLKAAAKRHGCFALLRSGGSPGIMYVRGDEVSVKKWVDIAHVSPFPLRLQRAFPVGLIVRYCYSFNVILYGNLSSRSIWLMDESFRMVSQMGRDVEARERFEEIRTSSPRLTVSMFLPSRCSRIFVTRTTTLSPLQLQRTATQPSQIQTPFQKLPNQVTIITPHGPSRK